jgi:hypothetical protein
VTARNVVRRIPEGQSSAPSLVEQHREAARVREVIESELLVRVGRIEIWIEMKPRRKNYVVELVEYRMSKDGQKHPTGRKLVFGALRWSQFFKGARRFDRRVTCK